MNQGAKYYRCDFQVHSPRDMQFIGNEYVSETEREQYSKQFIAACRDKRIDAVAIRIIMTLLFLIISSRQPVPKQTMGERLLIQLIESWYFQD